MLFTFAHSCNKMFPSRIVLSTMQTWKGFLETWKGRRMPCAKDPGHCQLPGSTIPTHFSSTLHEGWRGERFLPNFCLPQATYKQILT
jgi:hypothetical protein